MPELTAQEALKAALDMIDVRATIIDEMSKVRTAGACGAAGVVMLSMMTTMRDKGVISEADVRDAIRSAESIIAGVVPDESENFTAWAVAQVLAGMGGGPIAEPEPAEGNVVPSPSQKP